MLLGGKDGGVGSAEVRGGFGGEHKEVGDSLVCGCLHGPEFGGFPSFMGGPEPIWTLNLG